MREILEHKRLDRKFKKLPIEVLTRNEKWKDIVRLTGPQGLRRIKGFHDESLGGEWKDHRSSQLGLQFRVMQYRVIYQVQKQEIIVEVVELTAHDHTKK